MRRYLKWDYDNNVVIEYERHGECSQCGQCRKALITYNLRGRYTAGFAPMGTKTGSSGVWSEISESQMRRYAKLPDISKQSEHVCGAFKEGVGCTLHAKKSLRLDGKGALCTAWPIVPEHVAAFDQCSYTFVEIARNPIEPEKPLEMGIA